MLSLTLVGIVVLGLASHLTGRSEAIDHGLFARGLASRGVVIAVFAGTFLVLWYSWASWSPIPVVHDEMAYLLQAQIYARGHWSLPSPLMPQFWQQPHVLTEPRLAAKYFPGHPLLLAIGVIAGWNAFVPLALQSTSAVLLFVLARRIAGGAVALIAWIVWLFSPMELYFGASFYSEATTTACWLAGWYALLHWRDTRQRRWLVLVALFTGWDAITRPLTGVAYAIPIAAVVLRDVYRGRSWKDLAVALAVGTAIVALIPLWSARTTGQPTVTPLALYTRDYMPYDVPGFGLIGTPPAHALTRQLEQLNSAYSARHVNYYPSALPKTLAERSRYLSLGIWHTWSGVLLVFAVLGLLTLTGAGMFALASAIVLLLLYLTFAAPDDWALYYYESVPVYAFLTACGIAWAASLIGRPRATAPGKDTHWSSPRWTRALVSAGVIFVLPGIAMLRVMHRQHVTDRQSLVQFDAVLKTIHDERALLFVRYSEGHNAHVTFVRNTANLEDERVWVVYDRGDAENSRLVKLIPGRKAYLFDEQQQRLFVYAPAEHS